MEEENNVIMVEASNKRKRQKLEETKARIEIKQTRKQMATSCEEMQELKSGFPRLYAKFAFGRRMRLPYHKQNVRSKQRKNEQIKEVLGEFEVLLKRIGLCLAAVEVKEIENDEEYDQVANNINSFEFNIHTALAPYRKPGPTVDECLFVKDLHSISDDAYFHMRKICGLPVPALYVIKAKRDEVDSLMPLYDNQMGVYYSMKDKLRARVDAYFDVKYGTSSEIDSKEFQDFIIHVKFSADGTNIGRNLKILNFTFAIINEGQKAKTASGNYTIGIFEIEQENSLTVNESISDIRSELEELEEIEIRNQKVKVVYYLGGDWKMLAHSLGIQAANSKYCCIWCKCSKDEYYDLDKEWSITDPKKGARTHEEQAAILNHPDYEKLVNYGYKKEPIFRDIIPISRYMIDMLHLFLRISDSLFNLLVKDCCLADGFDMSAISSFQVKKYKHMNSLQHFLNEKCKVCFIFIWIPETKKLTWRDLTGPEKVRLFENFNLAEIIPDHERFDDVVKIWEEFYEIVNLVKAVEMESSEVKERTREWLRLYLSVYNKATVTPYMHAFVQHLHEFVFLYKDINAFNCQGLEKLNDITTAQFFSSTNRKQEALHQILKKRNRIEYFSDYINTKNLAE